MINPFEKVPDDRGNQEKPVVKCPDCGGNGKDDKNNNCKRCNGTGKIRMT